MQDPAVGVIVGRFQVDTLHDGHKDLIDFVASKHDRVIIFLGLSPVKCSVNNPLDFEARKQMILAEYPDVDVLYIKDTQSDYVWSERLDNMISDLIGPNQTAILYGSRDSFIRHYFGKYETYEYTQKIFISGTEIRKKISAKAKAHPYFRQGVIWAVNNQYPKPILTVDVAVFRDETYKELLLGKKKDEDKLRFIGGYVNAGETAETTVKREVGEEANIEVGNLTYISSFVVDDWRYRYEKDKITTLLFAATYMFGRPEPGDDIYSLAWVNINEITEDDIMDEHRPLLRALLKWRKIKCQVLRS